jgi:hypothetical protein
MKISQKIILTVGILILTFGSLIIVAQYSSKYNSFDQFPDYCRPSTLFQPRSVKIMTLDQFNSLKNSGMSDGQIEDYASKNNYIFSQDIQMNIDLHGGYDPIPICEDDITPSFLLNFIKPEGILLLSLLIILTPIYLIWGRSEKVSSKDENKS